MEYAAPVLHAGLTAVLAESLKSIQRCALKIVFGGSSFTNSSYLSFCESLAIFSLQCRRETLSINLFFIKFWNRLAVFITSFQPKDPIANFQN